MNKNITFRMWLKVFLGGMGQFIRNFFSWKNKTPFWRVIWITNTVCAIAIIYMFVAAWYKETYKRATYRSYYYTTDYIQQCEADTVVVVEELIDE